MPATLRLRSSNTHVIIDGCTVRGVPGALRVRPAPCLQHLFDAGRLVRRMGVGEFVAEASDLFARTASSARLHALCIVDFQGESRTRIEPLELGVAYQLVEQFGCPINTYAMKDDVLAFFRGDLFAFAEGYVAMKRQLREAIAGTRCLYVSADMMAQGNRHALRRAIDG